MDDANTVGSNGDDGLNEDVGGSGGGLTSSIGNVEVGVGVAEDGGFDLSTEGMGVAQRERGLVRKLGSAQENGGDGGLEVTHSSGGCDAGTCDASQHRTASSSGEGDGDGAVNQLDRLERRHNRMPSDLSTEVETHNRSSGRNQPGSWKTA
jgi:hypothetical protein